MIVCRDYKALDGTATHVSSSKNILVIVAANISGSPLITMLLKEISTLPKGVATVTWDLLGILNRDDENCACMISNKITKQSILHEKHTYTYRHKYTKQPTWVNPASVAGSTAEASGISLS